MLTHRRLRRTTWWTLALTLAAWILPAVLAAAGPAPAATAWVQVCTQQGMRWVPVAAGDPDGALSSHGAVDHCPYCTLGDPQAPPPARAETPRLPATAAPLARAASSAGRDRAPWQAPPARAPPPLA